MSIEDDMAALYRAELLLRREAYYADRGRWDDWLNLYTEDAVFWVPAWASESELVTDPETEVSIIYCDSRRELEHRIWRFTSGESAASTPLPRTNHLIQNVLIQDRYDDGLAVSANWLSQSYRTGEQYLYGGYYEYRLVEQDAALMIQRKKIVLINDRVDGYVDLYHL